MTAGRFNKVRRMADGIKATVSKTYRDGNKRPTVDVTIEGVELGTANLGDQRAIQRATNVPRKAVQALGALNSLKDDLGVGHHHEGVRAADGGLAHGDFSKGVQGNDGRPPRGQPMDAL